MFIVPGSVVGRLPNDGQNLVLTLNNCQTGPDLGELQSELKLQKDFASIILNQHIDRLEQTPFNGRGSDFLCFGWRGSVGAYQPYYCV